MNADVKCPHAFAAALIEARSFFCSYLIVSAGRTL